MVEKNNIKQHVSDDAHKDAHADMPVRDKKFANKVFNALNYIGLGFAANSALSLWITYNALPTERAQAGMGALRRGIVPLVRGWDKLKQSFGISGSKVINVLERENAIHNSARSAAEMLCMLIAGCVVLVPMKLLEDNKEAIVDKIDHWKNPDYYKHCHERGIEPESAAPKEEKPGWGKLLMARMGAMVGVMGIDAGLQLFNNHRAAASKSNLDTLEWTAGKKLYENLPEEARTKLINLFSRKGVSIEGVQPGILKVLMPTIEAPKELEKLVTEIAQCHGKIRSDTAVLAAPSWAERKTLVEAMEKTQLEPLKARLASALKTHPEYLKSIEKGIFAEQTRLLSKEVSLTMVSAAAVYLLSKTGIMSSVLSSLGVKSSKAQKKVIDDMLPDLPLVPVTHGEVDLGQTQATREQEQSAGGFAAKHKKEEKKHVSREFSSHSQRAIHSQSSEMVPQL